MAYQISGKKIGDIKAGVGMKSPPVFIPAKKKGSKKVVAKKVQALPAKAQKLVDAKSKMGGAFEG